MNVYMYVLIRRAMAVLRPSVRFCERKGKVHDDTKEHGWIPMFIDGVHVKIEHQRASGLLQQLDIPVWKWDEISMDFVTGLPRTQRRHDAIWDQVGERVIEGPEMIEVTNAKVAVAKEKLKEARTRQKSYADKHRRELEFQPGTIPNEKPLGKSRSLFGLLILISFHDLPLDIPVWKWDEISMDFVTGLPQTQRRHDTIWVVVDRLTKSAHFLPIRKDYSVSRLAEIFQQEIIRLHGTPSAVVSDRDPRFASRFWKGLQKAWGTRLKFSTAFHPQTGGQSERTIQTLEDMLRSCALEWTGN
nr:retrotransposable element Tf2 [Tanacetum cinerariifolium]